MHKTTIKHLIQSLTVILIYLLAASVCIRLQQTPGFAAIIWLPTGITLGVFLVWGIRHWLAIYLAIFSFGLINEMPVSTSLLVAFGNTMEGVFSYFLLTQFVGFGRNMGRIRDVGYFVLISTFLSTLISASIGVFALYSAGMIQPKNIIHAGVTWWAGNAVGSLVVVPLILAWFRGQPFGVRRGRWYLEVVALAVSLTAYSIFCFLGFPGRTQIVGAISPYFLILFLIWAALRFGQKGGTAAIALVAAVSVVGASYGLSPFPQSSEFGTLLFTQGFIVVAAVLSLILAAAITELRAAIFERTRAEAELLSLNRELESKVQMRTEEIKGSQEFLDTVIENLPNMVFVKDAKDLRFVRFNRAGEELLGYDRKELIGKNDYDFFSKEQADKFTANDRKVLEEGKLLDIPEEVITTRGGGDRILHTRKIPMYNQKSEPIFLLGISEDITERKITEEQKMRLQMEEVVRDVAERAFRREMFLSNASAMFAQSLDYREIMLSLGQLAIAELCDKCYVTAASNSLQPWTWVCGDRQNMSVRFLGGSDRGASPSVISASSRVFMSGESELFLQNAELENGQWIIVTPLTLRERIFGTLTLIADAQNRTFDSADLAQAVELARRAGMAIDNSLLYAEAENQKNQHFLARKNVEELARAAEAANQTKSLFLANMSHEIRTPLGVILGFVDIIKDPDIAPDDREKYAGIVQRNGQLLTQLIDDILDLSKVEAGCLEVESIETDLIKTVSDTISLLTVRAEEKGLKLTVKYLGKVPSAIYTDPLRLRQIIINVVGNAVKFTDQGAVSLTISMEGASSLAPTLVFKVEDTGPGISANNVEKLFSWFNQGDITMTRKYGGTGLGLALSRRLAQALGGNLTLQESTPKGSVFVFTISARVEAYGNPAEELGSARSSSVAEIESTRSLKDSHILLVDDSADNRLLIERFLSKHGVSVDVAQTGDEGVRKATSHNYDLVLMDVQMPVMDGITATKELRRLGFTKPILALTAHAMNEERAKTVQAGCNAHLTKPIDFSKLLSVLREYL